MIFKKNNVVNKNSFSMYGLKSTKIKIRIKQGNNFNLIITNYN